MDGKGFVFVDICCPMFVQIFSVAEVNMQTPDSFTFDDTKIQSLDSAEKVNFSANISQV